METLILANARYESNKPCSKIISYFLFYPYHAIIAVYSVTSRYPSNPERTYFENNVVKTIFNFSVYTGSIFLRTFFQVITKVKPDNTPFGF